MVEIASCLFTCAILVGCFCIYHALYLSPMLERISKQTKRKIKLTRASSTPDPMSVEAQLLSDVKGLLQPRNNGQNLEKSDPEKLSKIMEELNNGY